MRVMVIVKATTDAVPGAIPDDRFPEMGNFTESLLKAGVLLAAEGLRASSKGARVTFAGGRRTVLDGPFDDVQERVVGLWLWQVKSLDEAIEWARRGPFADGTEIEIRQVFEAEEFANELTHGPERRDSRAPLATTR
ncbi:MAG: hypothetical protein QOF49_87 [Chloroflexota bacterium]|nr:hypothetical protein [Chloroflexota bacterium]